MTKTRLAMPTRWAFRMPAWGLPPRQPACTVSHRRNSPAMALCVDRHLHYGPVRLQFQAEVPARLPVTSSPLPRHVGSGCSEGRRAQGPQLHEV